MRYTIKAPVSNGNESGEVNVEIELKRYGEKKCLSFYSPTANVEMKIDYGDLKKIMKFVKQEEEV